MSASQDDTLAANREAQRTLYGETLEVRIGGLLRAYAVPQRRLARALGISAPMLSQLISAQRVKMGNPLAHERMALLEERAVEAEGAMDPALAERVLEEVGASDVATTTQLRTLRQRTAGASEGVDVALPEMLASRIGDHELHAARELLAAHPAVAPSLRGLLEEAARHP